MAAQIPMGRAEITNVFNTSNVAVPRGEYTQIRIAGFGYGDESLENDISQVRMDMTIDTHMTRAIDKNADYHFDLLVFDRQDDYLCYVEAVHLMKHMNIIKKCSFVNDPDVFQEDMKIYEYDEAQFLSFETRQREFFVIIDNTEFKKAQTDPNWQGPPKERNPDGSEDIFVSVWFRTKYTSNTKYSSWMSMFVFIFIILGSLFVFSGICYWYQRYQYNKYAKERKQIKRELLKIKDTEYHNYLMQESEQYKNMQVWTRNQINSSQDNTINELDLDEEGTDDSN